MNYIQNNIGKALEEARVPEGLAFDASGKVRGPLSIGEKSKDFAKIYQEHAKSIYRFVLFKTNSHQDAEDITAEVFFQYLKKGGRLKQASILPWLYVVAGNLCVNHYRKKGRATLVERIEDNQAEQHHPWENSVIWQLVKTLGVKEQQVIYLRAIEDKSFREIGAALGKKEGAVKMIFYRAIGNLKGLIKESNDD